MTLFHILRRQIVAKIILCKIILTPLSIEKSKIYNLFVRTLIFIINDLYR